MRRELLRRSSEPAEPPGHFAWSLHRWLRFEQFLLSLFPENPFQGFDRQFVPLRQQNPARESPSIRSGPGRTGSADEACQKLRERMRPSGSVRGTTWAWSWSRQSLRFWRTGSLAFRARRLPVRQRPLGSTCQTERPRAHPCPRIRSDRPEQSVFQEWLPWILFLLPLQTRPRWGRYERISGTRLVQPVLPVRQRARLQASRWPSRERALPQSLRLPVVRERASAAANPVSRPLSSPCRRGSETRRERFARAACVYLDAWECPP